MLRLRPLYWKAIRRLAWVAVWFVFNVQPSIAGDSDKAGRVIQSFDSSWRFLKADAAGAERLGFDDCAWPMVDVPHDWAIEGPIAETNSTGKHGAFLPCGVSWYRKSFGLPEHWRSRRLWIEFDGVMANSEVWINGELLGKRPSGYVSFRYDLTGHLRFGAGETNVIAVRTDTSVQPASRWYAGAGIYRHVRLVSTDPVHLEPWSVFVSTPQVSTQSAVVRVAATLVNQSAIGRDAVLRVAVYGPNGSVAGSAEAPQRLASGAAAALTLEIPIQHPCLWDVTNPCLYEARCTLCSGEQVLDCQATPIGIRDARWEPATGFWLNGRNLKIKGLCMHQDAGALGAAVPLRAWERRFEILRQIGCNAIRTSHNPPAPEFLDLADRMGFLVMHEVFDTWIVPKREADDSRFFAEWWERDLGDTLLRDRNHPCVIIYSAGNEIQDLFKPNGSGLNWFKRLREVYHKVDPTRPVTLAGADPGVSGCFTNGLAELQDVVGQNYADSLLVSQRKLHPAWKVISSEDFRTRRAWVVVRDSPDLAGQFVWCAFDYLGESFGWPEISYDYGIFDRTGSPTGWAWERAAYWSEKPVVCMLRQEKDMISRQGVKGTTGRFADWTPHYPDYKTARVVIFGNCQEVEVLLNGRSLGTHRFAVDASPVTMEFPFEPGTVKALGRKDGKVVCSQEMRTAGKPARITLSVDRAIVSSEWDDVATAVVRVVDENGIQIPLADDLITFAVAGPGKLVATDSGDLATHEPFQGSNRHAFNGQCLVMAKATAESGEITLTATAPGLSAGMITLQVRGNSGNSK